MYPYDMTYSQTRYVSHIVDVSYTAAAVPVNIYHRVLPLFLAVCCCTKHYVCTGQRLAHAHLLSLSTPGYAHGVFRTGNFVFGEVRFSQINHGQRWNFMKQA